MPTYYRIQDSHNMNIGASFNRASLNVYSIFGIMGRFIIKTHMHYACMILCIFLQLLYVVSFFVPVFDSVDPPNSWIFCIFIQWLLGA